jgi:hypothetical protein
MTITSAFIQDNTPVLDIQQQVGKRITFRIEMKKPPMAGWIAVVCCVTPGHQALNDYPGREALYRAGRFLQGWPSLLKRQRPIFGPGRRQRLRVDL